MEDEHLHNNEDESEMRVTNEIHIKEVYFSDMKEMELENWRNHEVYREVEDLGQKCISTRWIYTMKEVGDKIQRKARLVSKGFEE